MDTNCLTVREVADRLRVSPATVYHLCARRRLPHVRVGARGGAIRVREQDLHAFLDSCQVETRRQKDVEG
jgi:excisionase family DNA binding protein